MQRRTFNMAVGFGLAAVLLASPMAAAYATGVDAAGLNELKSAGGAPQYSQIWAGKWLATSGWSVYEKEVRAARDAGVTPVILWYYWGDSISVDAVKYGKDGKSKSQWDSMAKELAVRTKNIMGSKEFIVVLEPEFNKNGITSWETFDGYLENQANIVRSNAPAAKIAVGFGYWGGWDIFDRAMAKSHYAGFQMMRASTRDSSSLAHGAADQSIDVAKKLKAKFGKPVILFDLAISSYGGWEGVQEKSIQNFGAKRSSLDSAGIAIIIYRNARDNDNSKGYFGAAESHWGLKKSSGSAKPAWDDWVAISRGGSSGSTSTTSTSTSTSLSSTSGWATFSGVKVDEWWVQTSVSGSKAVSKVHARVNGGSWVELSKQSWGGYTKSINVKSGQSVEFRATATDGSTQISGKYTRDGSTTTSTSTSTSLSASFSNVKVDAWWVQTSVSADKSISKVDVRVNGGSWTTLEKKSYGYAKSVNVKSGQYVEFRATATDGSAKISGKYWR